MFNIMSTIRAIFMANNPRGIGWKHVYSYVFLESEEIGDFASI